MKRFNMRHLQKFILTTGLAVTFLILGLSIACAADESSCIKCHSNDAIMKSLHKPQPLPPGESGEG